MSGRILRRVRVAQTIPSPSLTLPTRRCYGVFAAVQVASPSHDHDLQPVAGPSNSETAQSERWQSKPVSENGTTAHSSTSQASGKHAGELRPSASSRPQTKSAFPKGVEEHLASVAAAGLEPTQSDLDKCRPPNHANPDHPKYVSDYNAVVDTLCRCFSRAQLRKFIMNWDRNSPLAGTKYKKIDYAESIVEKLWGWPSLKEMERAKRDRTEVATRSFPVKASEMFLIMGKDGADLLEMSRTYQVHVSLSTDPFALSVEGVRGALKKVAERIDSIKESITEAVFPLPIKAPVRPYMLQRISRLTGALLENLGSQGTVRIYAKTQRSLETAKRLATRASHEFQLNVSRERLAYQPSLTAAGSVPAALFPSTYALYPFLSPQPLPWTMSSGGAFRMRRVGAWFNAGGEDLQATGGLTGGRGRLLTRSKDPVDLQEVLMRDLPSLSDSQLACRRVVKASTGHVLLTPSSPGQRISLVPPFPGNHAFKELLKWMNKRGARTGFVPSLPAPLVNSSPSREKVVHRVLYRAVQPRPTEDQHHVSKNKFLSFEVVLVQPRTDADSFDSSLHLSDDDPVDEEPAIPALYSDAECYTGVENEVDVMLPDRPMDVQFIAQSLTLITPDKHPPELRMYTTNLRTYLTDVHAGDRQPDPPLTFNFGGDTWIMHSSASVRQSTEAITLSSGMSLPGEAGYSMRAVSESVLDLESNQKSAHCELVCDDPTSMESWSKFLADCDALTSTTYQPIGNVALEGFGDDIAI
ncbi:hypothetical protein DAEQUDRAFT_23709 [Daedalea quercina L-15889]|uniref:Uncharacterized protein n=1 Tax=Daedalea quercina L-15889 TaxID=1314783 RepID=A0A165UN15_9APHY|nr:hypothetical protein DAEQUDRAFT_23709 [Daedalea quercina L-15889]